jgi:hypothetical protein
MDGRCIRLNTRFQWYLAMPILVGRLPCTLPRPRPEGLVCIGCMGMFCLLITDLVGTPTSDWNEGNVLAVSPNYIVGYFYVPVDSDIRRCDSSTWSGHLTVGRYLESGPHYLGRLSGRAL